MVVVSRSVMSNSVTPWTVAHQAPLSMGFSKQEQWSGLPFPPRGYLPEQVTKGGVGRGSPSEGAGPRKYASRVSGAARDQGAGVV